MDNVYKEPKSMLEVREWREQCRIEDAGLTAKEYLEKIKTIAAGIKSKYNIKLQKYIPASQCNK